MDKYRIIVPATTRKEVLDLLHIPHQGQTKTYLAATSRYYWPGMKEEITKAIENCLVCRELTNNQPVRQPREEDILQRNREPFERLSLDQFMIDNTQYLVIMDRFSSYLFVIDLGKKTSARKVEMELEKLTLIFGMPRRIRHNDGGQFRGAFLTYLKEIRCQYETSSGYYAPSNGIAEYGVRML